MKFSYNLLKQFVRINVSAGKLGELLTGHSVEVEEVNASGTGFEGIVAAKVIDARKHPNADRLRIVKLDMGRIINQVVCGAFNFEAGDTVALALPGAKIPKNIHSEKHESFILQKAVIRGVESQGMICAAFELGLAGHPGEKPEIMVLDKAIQPGLPLAEALKLSPDYILNIALPANRPDLHSHLGMAREIAAVLGTSYRLKIESFRLKPSKNWKIIVKNKILCPRYFAVRMKVRVGPSPKFIADSLTAVGMRPINNVVDITNYVMIELGQPTHAFDAKFVKGDIIVKTAKKGEKFLALNHKEYELNDDTLMICDRTKNLALGAIIGGKQSEVSDRTSEIILEAANFQGAGVRKTSKKLNVRTEGSAVWEKGIHPRLAELGLMRSMELLKKYASAEITDFAKFETPIKKPKAIKFTDKQINRLLGTSLSIGQIKSYLKRYGIIVKGAASATPPWWRTDITSMPDLAEESLKLYGYNKIKPQAMNVIPAAEAGLSSDNGFDTGDVYQTKNLFARLGYTEVQNYNFLSADDIVKFGGNPKDHVEIQNPLSEDQRYLKKYPLIPLLKNINLNQKHHDKFKLFEVGKQYFGFDNEPLALLAVIFSKTAPIEKLIMVLKADLLELLRYLNIENARFESQNPAPGVRLKLRGTDAGGYGSVSPELCKNFDIQGNAVFLKLDLEKILADKTDIIYRQINKFPAVSRDISVIVNSKINWSEIENLILPVSKLITQISLFEAPFLSSDKDSQKFHQQLAKTGQKNYGIRLVLEAFDRTLTDPEVAGILDQIVLKLKSQINAEIR